MVYDTMARVYKDKRKGKVAVAALQAVKEVVEWGFDSRKKLWVILNIKHGTKLGDLKSFRDAVEGGPVECEKYMDEIRDAIVRESERYFAMRGGPKHRSVRLSLSRPLSLCSCSHYTAILVKRIYYLRMWTLLIREAKKFAVDYSANSSAGKIRVFL